MPSLDEVRAFVRLHLKQRAYDYPAPDGDLDVVSLGYDPDAFEKTISAFGDRFDVVEVARLAYRDTARPMFSVSSHNVDAPQRLLIVSGIHGNEQAGIVSVPEILDRFDAGGAVAVRVLTPTNPVGAAEFSRFNADGYDINRDFLQFRTEEARIVRAAFDDFDPHFVLSLHEGPQTAAFIFANPYVDDGLARRLLAALEAGGTTLATKDYFGLPLRPPGLSASSPFQRTVLRVWEATLKMQAVNAFAAARGLPEITLETGWRGSDGAARVRAHVDLFVALCRELSA
ncbi:MAG TPA: succinylglutamate desuccinylase/aspartoacylase family protein [Acidimicrobiales bacterium]|nr:succinylglutamate desuccinylase/aspartoacylase family protein [Acidimicrobiales bacterium]